MDYNLMTTESLILELRDSAQNEGVYSWIYWNRGGLAAEEGYDRAIDRTKEIVTLLIERIRSLESMAGAST